MSGDQGKTHYSLRCINPSLLAGQKALVVAGDEPIVIGQTPDCDLRVRNDSGLADERYATIRPCPHSEGWLVAPLSEFVAMSVNGVEVEVVHYLESGDTITFGDGLELRFKTHRGEPRPTPQQDWVKIATLSLIGILALVVLYDLVLASLIETYHLNQAVEKSVYQIRVDSVYYLRITPQGEEVIGQYSYSHQADGEKIGTAFLSTDSLLITARHCIEPWLMEPIIDTIFVPEDLPEENPLKWAFLAETANQNSLAKGSVEERVVSICKLYKNPRASLSDTADMSFRSDQFAVNTERDNVVNSWDNYYYRSIRNYRFSRRNARLGDIAYAKSGHAGKIKLASPDYIEGRGTLTELYAIGYPAHADQSSDSFSFQKGDLKDRGKDKLLAHSIKDVVEGFSGGPVVITSICGVTAIGVVSIEDSHDNGITYSVPVTEIQK